MNYFCVSPVISYDQGAMLHDSGDTVLSLLVYSLLNSVQQCQKLVCIFSTLIRDCVWKMSVSLSKPKVSSQSEHSVESDRLPLHCKTTLCSL